MASTPTINACQVDEKTEEQPSLVERIKAFLPPHSHVAAPIGSGDYPRPDSFEATWTTDAGVWSIVYAGMQSPAMAILASSLGQAVVPKAKVVVNGPGGKWGFPADVPPSHVQEFLVSVKAIALPEAPPAPPKGFLYVGKVSEDGLSFPAGSSVSFTTEGQVSAEAVDVLTGGASESWTPPGRDPERDVARARVDVQAEERDATRAIREAQDRLADARRRAAHLRRVPDLLPKFQEKAVIARFGSDPVLRGHMLHVSDAALVAAELLADAAERHRISLAAVGRR
jgi:hypothetical protein